MFPTQKKAKISYKEREKLLTAAGLLMEGAWAELLAFGLG